MSQRLRRVNESIMQIVAELLPSLKDPRIGFVTVTDVRTTNDIRQSQIFFTVLPDDEDNVRETLAGLKSAAPLIRHELGSGLRTRLTPELVFVHDPVPEQGRRIEQILRDVPPAVEHPELDEPDDPETDDPETDADAD